MSNFVLPQNSQLLFYPMKQCTISAGFKAKKYKDHYGYNHYGVDFDSLGDTDFDVLAGATGEVLGVEMNNGSAGGIVVIKYVNIYVPSKKKTMDLIARYAHMITLYVKKGDRVAAYTPIGKVSGNHKWYNHIHMEVDTDTKYPFYTVTNRRQFSIPSPPLSGQMMSLNILKKSLRKSCRRAALLRIKLLFSLLTT